MKRAGQPKLFFANSSEKFILFLLVSKRRSQQIFANIRVRNLSHCLHSFKYLSCIRIKGPYLGPIYSLHKKGKSFSKMSKNELQFKKIAKERALDHAHKTQGRIGAEPESCAGMRKPVCLQ